jgi:hypothetical protein
VRDGRLAEPGLQRKPESQLRVACYKLCSAKEHIHAVPRMGGLSRIVRSRIIRAQGREQAVATLIPALGSCASRMTPGERRLAERLELDYHHPSPKLIHNSAVILLSDTRLGYPAWNEVRQVKSLPAPGEEEKLLHHFGKDWTKLPLDKHVYIHDGFCFGVLVCSELQNISHRARFQGDVDSVFVLSWNQDLETFSSLVESASLDVHAFVALVNNRRYGDSRVRAPGKPHHQRDLCRLRGGENEHLVVVRLNVQTLRAFQSRAKRWPVDDDPFKPVPEAFNLDPRRKCIPS